MRRKNIVRKKKIVIMGMENAGKTTIVDFLTHEPAEKPTTPPKMHPTVGVKRKSLFKKNLVVWDFGGQEMYRNGYLANPEKYFVMISFFYYVLDIQDFHLLMSSTMYFMAVFQLIKKLSPEAKIVFLFHKMDPDFDPNKRNIKQKFLDKVEPLLQANNRSFITYDTTIFDLNSIITAFKIVY